MTESKPVYESRKTKAHLRAEIEQMKLNSALTARANLSRGLGKSFSGARDLYKVLGYPEKLTYDDFANAYARDGLATRIVDAVSDETWRETPILIEGENKKKDELDKPSQLQIDFTKLADRLDLFGEFNDADAYCGISRYAVLVLGLPGKMSEPAPFGGKLAYVMAHDEGSATISTGDIETNVESERFGLPNFYTVTMDVDNASATQRIHWSRCIHIREGRTKSRTYGVPRLQSMYNRIQDLEKVVGGGSEAFWLLIHRGLALTAKEGTSLPSVDSAAYKDMIDEVDEYEHGISRIMRLIGLDVTDLGGRPVDSDAQFRTLVAYLAGASRIPQRILIGSEAGHLASSQDEYNFASYIVSRQKKFAEPKILRAFIDKCGALGILEVPAKYSVDWPSLFQLTDAEEANIASVVAGAMATATGGAPETIMPPAEFAQRYLDYVPEIPDPAEVLKPREVASTPAPEDKDVNVPINIEALKPKSWQLHTEPVGWDLLNTNPLKPADSIYPTAITMPAPAYDETRVKIVLSKKEGDAPFLNEGNENSGNHGHAGREGKVGGSAPKGAAPVPSDAVKFKGKLYHRTKAENVPAISSEGLRVTEGGRIQDGVYFARGSEMDAGSGDGTLLSVDIEDANLAPKASKYMELVQEERDKLKTQGVRDEYQANVNARARFKDELGYDGFEQGWDVVVITNFDLIKNVVVVKQNEGNADSGNHDHAGRPGKVGGSDDNQDKEPKPSDTGQKQSG